MMPSTSALLLLLLAFLVHIVSFGSTQSTDARDSTSISTNDTSAVSTTSTTSTAPDGPTVLVGPPLTAGPATSTSIWTYTAVGTYSPTASSSYSLSTSSTSTASSSSSASTTTTKAAVHTITVGKGYNQFEPVETTADVGDIVVFQFYPWNHSVVQAEFLYPCIPFSTMNPGAPMFFSGFFPLPSVPEDPPTWNLTINDTEPIFFYCSAPGSCIQNGMVGGINLNSTTPISAQISVARSDDMMLQPGEPFHSEAETSSIASIAASARQTAESSETTLASSDVRNRSLSPGIVAGITIAALVVLLLAGALVWYVSRSRTLKEALHREQKTSEAVVNAVNDFPDTNASLSRTLSPSSGTTRLFSPNNTVDHGGLSGQDANKWREQRLAAASSPHQGAQDFGGNGVTSPVQSPRQEPRIGGGSEGAPVELEAKLARHGKGSDGTLMVTGSEPALSELGGTNDKRGIAPAGSL